MTESIGTKLASLIESIVPLYLGEAASDQYPYATYDQTLSYRRSKDGVAMISSECTIYVYAKTFDTADTAAGSIVSTLETSMRDSQYCASLRTVDKDCVQGVWNIQLTYNIKQFK